MINVTVDTKHYRSQSDDWLAGGKVEYKGQIYYWSAQNSNYGFGWEVEPITEEEWEDIPEDESAKISKLIEECLYEHKTEYVF